MTMDSPHQIYDPDKKRERVSRNFLSVDILGHMELIKPIQKFVYQLLRCYYRTVRGEESFLVHELCNEEIRYMLHVHELFVSLNGLSVAPKPSGSYLSTNWWR